VSKLGEVKIFSKLHILVDFKYLFLSKCFELEIWNSSYQHRDDLVQKISWQKKFSILGRVAKWIVVKFGFQLHILVDFEYLFLCEFFGLKFSTYVINIGVILCQKFHGKKAIS